MKLRKRIRKRIRDWWEGYVPTAPNRALPPEELEKARQAYLVDWDANFRQPGKDVVTRKIKDGLGLLLWIPLGPLFFPGMATLYIIYLVSPQQLRGGSGMIDGIIWFIGIVSLLFWAAAAILLWVTH